MPQVPYALVSRVDATIGAGVEAAVRAKHERRLDRLGWARALRPDGAGTWAAGSPPPRDGCVLDVLIDGEEAMAAIAEAIASAREFVHITGWHFAAGFELVRGKPSGALGALLAEAAERVDV